MANLECRLPDEAKHKVEDKLVNNLPFTPYSSNPDQKTRTFY